jgi:hypothetical protein
VLCGLCSLMPGPRACGRVRAVCPNKSIGKIVGDCCEVLANFTQNRGGSGEGNNGWVTRPSLAGGRLQTRKPPCHAGQPARIGGGGVFQQEPPGTG